VRAEREGEQCGSGCAAPLLLLLVRPEGQNRASEEAERGAAHFGERGTSAGATEVPGAGRSRTPVATRRPASAAIGRGAREREVGCG
jgi:hypothetical protein